MSKYSVRKPYTVLVGVILVIVLGAVSITRMTADLLPDMNLPYVVVITAYPGASPEEVERNVTAPVEAQMATTSNISTIQSMSYNNYSLVILEYEQSSNMDSIVIEMQQKLDQVSGSFPNGVASPLIMKLDPSMLPIMVASADVEGMTQVEISDYVDSTIVPYLESVEGVASVSTIGSIEEKVEITLDEDKIKKINNDVIKEIEDGFADAQSPFGTGTGQDSERPGHRPPFHGHGYGARTGTGRGICQVHEGRLPFHGTSALRSGRRWQQ